MIQTTKKQMVDADLTGGSMACDMYSHMVIFGDAGASGGYNNDDHVLRTLSGCECTFRWKVKPWSQMAPTCIDDCVTDVVGVVASDCCVLY